MWWYPSCKKDEETPLSNLKWLGRIRIRGFQWTPQCYYPPPKKNKDTNHITMMVQNMYFFWSMDILDIYLEFQRGTYEIIDIDEMYLSDLNLWNENVWKLSKFHVVLHMFKSCPLPLVQVKPKKLKASVWVSWSRPCSWDASLVNELGRSVGSPIQCGISDARYTHLCYKCQASLLKISLFSYIISFLGFNVYIYNYI